MTDEPLPNTLENPGPFDAMVKLRPGEPYFPLIGRDRSAPPLVQAWANGNREKALREHRAGDIDDDVLRRELEKSADAERIGWAMADYKERLDRPGDDELPLDKPNLLYSGHVLDDETRKRDELAAAKSRAVAAMRNAEAMVDDLLKLIQSESIANRLDDLKEDLRTLGDDLTPPRPGQAK